MRAAYDETKTAFRLGSQLARGGQGVISYLDGVQTHCIKIYHHQPAARQISKLQSLRSKAPMLAKLAALPTSIAFSDPELKSPVGIFIPFVKGHEIYELYGTRARIQHFPKANFKFLVHAAYNLAVSFEELHANGIVVGDINEQNVKVLPDATVCLIDCDSFQITDGTTIYTCDVGTPIWTPPELQGCNLTNLQRTANHDLFGLAQLVFLLLFTGRHPFSGVPRTSRQLLLEEAIREYAFAFAPPHMGLALAPPPGCPSVNALPPAIQQSFARAFLRGSEKPAGRPSAKDWKTALSQLLQELVTCGRHPGHVFWKGSSVCPWCAVIKEAGVDLFPAPLDHIFERTSGTEKDDGYVARLAGLRPYPFAVQAPQAFNDLSPEPLPPKPTGFWSSLHKTIASGSWKRSWLGNELQRNAQALSAAEAALIATFAEQQSAVTTYNQDFNRVRTLIQPLVQALNNAATIRREIEAAVEKERRELELKEFLERFQLRQASVRDIGPGRKATLQSYGIETAADIAYHSIEKVPGFGPALTRHLMNWLGQCETKFRFDPSRPISAYLRYETERRIQEKIRQLKEQLAQMESKLNLAERRCAEKLRSVQARAVQHARQRDQAKANLATLNSV